MRLMITLALVGTAMVLSGQAWAACDESTAANKTLFYQFGIEDGQRGRAPRVTGCAAYTAGLEVGRDLRSSTQALGSIALTDENFQKLLNGTLLSNTAAGTNTAALGGNGKGERVLGSSRARVITYTCNEKKVAWQQNLMEKGRRDGAARVPKLLPNCRSYEQGYMMGLRGGMNGGDFSRSVVGGNNSERVAKEMNESRDRGRGMSIGAMGNTGSSARSIGGGGQADNSSGKSLFGDDAVGAVGAIAGGAISGAMQGSGGGGGLIGGIAGVIGSMF